MRFRFALTIYGLCLMLMLVSGCETIKGVAKGGADGFSQDWHNTKDNIQQIDEWAREKLW